MVQAGGIPETNKRHNMKTSFKVFLIVIAAWFTMGATGCSEADNRVSTGGGAYYNFDAKDGSSISVDNSAATPSAEGGDLPVCDGTSATAEAEGRCVSL